MSRLELIGGAYTARSVIANAQKCLNLYPERNREDASVPFTYYQRPGLELKSSPPSPAIGRGVFRDSQGNGYAVVGQELYQISPLWAWTPIGTLVSVSNTLCSISDNGQTAVLGDGSAIGYSWTIGNAAASFAQIVDPSGIFTGTIKWDVLDGFLVWVIPGSQLFGSTLDNEVVFDATYFGSKNGYPDPLVTLFVNRRIMILFGQVRSEIWYDAGNALFPFAVQPGAYIEWGCSAVHSVAQIGITVMWLGQNQQGEAVVLQQEGYNTSVISNHAISFAIEQMVANGADLSDAIAYTYIQGGHIFYVLTFMSGNQTWVYDASIKDPGLAWHQRGWTNLATGRIDRERGISGAFLFGSNVVQDWQNGALYALNASFIDDYVNGVAGPVQYVRTFPQIKQGFMTGRGPTGFGRMPVATDGHGVTTVEFVADFEGGNGALAPTGNPPQISLRWSTDRGRTWGNEVLQSAGISGDYGQQPKWPNLGYARYPLFELTWSGFRGALNGAWIEPVVTTR
jgi:hypothetical protein